MKLKLSILVAVLSLVSTHAFAASDPIFLGPPIKTGDLTITQLSQSLTGTVGAYFSARFQVSGGTPVYGWQATTLPAGLNMTLEAVAYTNCYQPQEASISNDDLQNSNCPAPYVSGEYMVVSGKPSEKGSFTTTLTATDSKGLTGTKSFTFTITDGTAPSALEILASENSGSATVGQYYLASFSGQGGSRPYSWTVSGQLPPGIVKSYPEFNCVTTPCIAPVELYDSLYLSGKPTTAGIYTYTLTLKDASGQTVSRTFTTVVDGTNTAGIVVTNPKSGDTWATGKEYTIFWTNMTLGSRALNVNITLSAPRPSCLDAVPACKIQEPAPYTIASNAPDTGYYTWKVPADLPTVYLGARYITVATVTGSLSGNSGQFTLSAGSKDTSGPVTIVNPGSGAQWSVGKTYTIQWDDSNNLPVKLTLQPQQACALTYCQATSSKTMVIAQNISGTSYAWTVPASIDGQILNGTYRIGLETVAPGVDFVLWGQSGAFSIVSATTPTPTPRPSPTPTIVPVITTLAPADVVRTPDKAVSLVLDGQKYYTFPTWEEFLSKGYVFQHIKAVAQNSLGSYAQTSIFERPSGTTFKYAGDRTVYYLTTEKCKQAYTSFGVFQAWRVRLIDVVLFQTSEQFPTCSSPFVRLPNGVAIRYNTRTVYILENGRLRPITNFPAYQRLGSPEVFTIEQSDFNSYQAGEVIE